MATNTLASNFSADVATYIAQKTLSIALKRLVMYQLCDKVEMPKNSSRTFQYSRYERVALPLSKLTEGVTPGDTSMALTTVNAVLDQWGAVIPISDVAIDSVRHPVLQKAIDLAGHQAQEVLDREIVKVALSGTNIYYPNAITSRATLTAGDKISSAAVGKMVAYLRDYGAMPFDDSDLYVGVVDSFANEDLINDATFIDAAKYGMIKKLLVNEIGEWKGVRWVRSNVLYSIKPIAVGAGASSATAGSLVASTSYNYAWTVVDANTGFETYVSPVTVLATAAAQTSLDITSPALPAAAPAGSTFNLYFGSNGGTLFLAQSSVPASTLKNQGVLPTSGNVAPASAPAGVTVHYSFVLGKEGLACIELNKIKAYMTPAVSSDSDPLVQRRKVGWKTDFKAMITNQSFMARLEHATTNS